MRRVVHRLVVLPLVLLSMSACDSGRQEPDSPASGEAPDADASQASGPSVRTESDLFRSQKRRLACLRGIGPPLPPGDGMAPEDALAASFCITDLYGEKGPTHYLGTAEAGVLAEIVNQSRADAQPVCEESPDLYFTIIFLDRAGETQYLDGGTGGCGRTLVNQVQRENGDEVYAFLRGSLTD